MARQLLTQRHDIQPGQTSVLLVIGLAMVDMFTRTRGAKNRHRPYDVSNHVKVIEDIVKKLIGVDDSQSVAVHVYKFVAAREATYVAVSALPNDDPASPAGLEVLTDVFRRIALQATR